MNSVTTYGESGVVSLRFVYFQVTCETAVGDVFDPLLWYFFFLYEKYCVCSFDSPIFEALS